MVAFPTSDFWLFSRRWDWCGRGRDWRRCGPSVGPLWASVGLVWVLVGLVWVSAVQALV